MSEIVQSLFGLSPQAFQQQRQQQADAQALALAQLDPFQRASFGIQRGANRLAGAVGGMLGGQDPELQRRTQAQQILGMIDPSDPDTFLRAAEMALQGGDQQLALGLRDEHAKRAAANQQAMQASQLSEAQIEAQQALATQRLREKDGADPIQQLLRTGKFTPASIAKYQTSGEIGDLKSADSDLQTQVVETAQGQMLINKRTGETIVNLGAAPDRRTVNKITVGGTAENAYAKVVGEGVAKDDLNIIDNAQSIVGTLPKMYETRKLLDTGALNTGFAAELQQVVDRAKTKILADKEAGKRVTDTEYLNALLGSDVFPQISQLGIGARGLDTPAEREFLREVITGTISMDLETLKRMTDFRIGAAERAVTTYNKKLKAGEFNQYQTTTGRRLAPVQTVTPPRPSRGDGTPGNPIKLD